jgi:hypothetical protein
VLSCIDVGVEEAALANITHMVGYAEKERLGTEDSAKRLIRLSA